MFEYALQGFADELVKIAVHPLPPEIRGPWHQRLLGSLGLGSHADYLHDNALVAAIKEKLPGLSKKARQAQEAGG